MNVYPGVIQNYNIHTHLIQGPKPKGNSTYKKSYFDKHRRMIRNDSQYQLLLKYVAHWWKFDKHFAIKNRDFLCADIYFDL